MLMRAQFMCFSAVVYSNSDAATVMEAASIRIKTDYLHLVLIEHQVGWSTATSRPGRS